MLTVFLTTFVAVLLIVSATAVGVVFSGKRLRGSCGGTGGDDCWCEKRQLDPSSCPAHEAA